MTTTVDGTLLAIKGEEEERKEKGKEEERESEVQEWTGLLGGWKQSNCAVTATIKRLTGKKST